MPHPKRDKIVNRRTLYVDIDDTLLMHNLSDYPKKGRVTILCNGRKFVGYPNQKNLNCVEQFYKLGYEIIAWSKTGQNWAEEVTEKLGIGHLVTHCLSKPDFYLDDYPVENWIGPRVYRGPDPKPKRRTRKGSGRR